MLHGTETSICIAEGAEPKGSGLLLFHCSLCGYRFFVRCTLPRPACCAGCGAGARDTRPGGTGAPVMPVSAELATAEAT